MMKNPLTPPSSRTAQPSRPGKSQAAKRGDGRDVWGWIEKTCYIPEGKLVGQPFRLLPWQKREICRIYNNKRKTRRAILSFARKNGKGLALDTPIPTPRGWSRMGNLRVGDEVFDERGEICRVTFVSPVHIGLRCWRLRFADGSEIVADEQHQWVTTHSYKPWVKARVNGTGNGGRWETGIVTTPHISDSVLRKRPDGGIEHNHKVAVAGALNCPPVDQPIPAYVLGYWLGDGNSANATVTVGRQDEADCLFEIESELGFELTARAVGCRTPQYGMTRRRGGDRSLTVQHQLRMLGVLGNKHIPNLYLWASREQRLALLQGLMDSDGGVSGNVKAPHCYFDVMNETLARDTLSLVRSLGLKASIIEGVAKIDGREIGPVWSVSFTAFREDNVFRFARKNDRLSIRRKTRASTNAIVACEEMASVPTRCIQVDSPSHLFLAGYGFTPTHNTALAACLLLVHLCGPRAKPNSQLFSAAQSRDQAAILFSLAAKIVRISPALRSAVVVRDTAKELVCPGLGTRYRALSAEASTAYGLSPAFVVHDELGQVRGPRSPLFEALETATGAQEEPLSLIISTQAPTDADLLSILIDDALAGNDPRTLVSLYTAPAELDTFSLEAIKAANPALGKFLNKTEVLAMAEDARRMPARQAEYENLILNRRVEVSNPFVSRPAWQACGGAVGDLHGVPLYAGLDLSSVSDLTALVLIGRIGKIWNVQPTFWLPSEGLRAKAQKDRVPYDLWETQGHLQTTPGATVSYEYVATYLRTLFDNFNIQKLGFDRWNMKHLTPWLIKAGFSEQLIKEKFVEFGQGTQSMSPALRDLEQAIREKELAHGNHPVLTMCAACAVVEAKDDANRKLSKNKSTGRIDGLVALAMAMGVAPLAAKAFDIEALIG